MHMSPLSPAHSVLATQGVRWARAAAPCRHKTRRARRPPRPRPRTASPRGARVSTLVKERPRSTWLAGGNLGERSTLWTLAALGSKIGIGFTKHLWMLKAVSPAVLHVGKIIIQCGNASCCRWCWCLRDWGKECICCQNMSQTALLMLMLFYFGQHCHQVV